MAQPPYIPTKDALLVSWADNFNSLITATPSLYGLTSGDATTIDTAVSAFDSAYAAAIAPSTRTKPSVAAKDAAREAMLAVVRPYSITIKNNAGVSNDDKLALGLNVSSTARTPILVPQTQPLISIVGATPGTFTVRYADSNTPDKRGKPFGALQIQFQVALGTAPSPDPDEGTSFGLFTIQPAALTFTVAAAGKVATLWARWVGRRGDVGPWSLPVSQIVSF